MAFTRVGHALFASDGVRLAFGKRWDGKIIHISEANRGAACGCECPAQNCRRKLIARKSDSDIAHHFAHAPLTSAERAAGVNPNCTYSVMSALHAYAEQLLSKHKRLVLPPVTATLGGRTLTARRAKSFAFDTAKLETLDGETIPDVILFKRDEKLHVEVFVAHRCGPEKQAKLIAADIPAVEIDLSGLSRDVTLVGLDEAILETAPRKWLHNRKTRVLVERLEEQAKAAVERARKLRQDAVAALSGAYADARRQALAADWKGEAVVLEVMEAGEVALLDGAVGGEGYFSVHPKVWKAVILRSMLGHFSGVTPASIVSEFNRRGWVIGRFRKADVSDDLAAEAGLPAGGPERAVEKYLNFLATKGVAEDSGWTWEYTAYHSQQREQRKRAKELAAYDAARRASRREQLADLAGGIVALGNPGGQLDFQFNAWLDHEVGEHSIAQLVYDGGAAWSALLKGLTQTLAVLKDQSEEPVEDFGLPVRTALDAAQAVHEERAKQRKIEAEEKARIEIQARANGLLLSAHSVLGEAHLAWMDAIHPSLNGLSPRQAAEASAEQLARADRLLDQCRLELEQKARWIGEFEREAIRILPSSDHVSLFLNSSHPRLRGQLAPKAYIKDQTTMAECLALLKKKSHR